jgi:hypothetical protein
MSARSISAAPVVTMAVATMALLVAGCPGDDAASDPTDDGASSTSVAAGSSTGAAQTSTTGAADESSSGDVLPVIDYGSDVQPIWNGACTCHLQGPSGTMQATVLTLNEGVSYGELVDVGSTQAAGVLRVAPGNVEGSYLWNKLQGTHLDAGGSGTAMPQVGTLTPEQQLAIEVWISTGAEP